MALMNYNPFEWYNSPMSIYSHPPRVPARLFGQHFGSGVLDHELMAMRNELRKNGISEIKCNKDKYQVMLDVQHFKPEEIKVKTVDNVITVEGHHEEKQDEHGYILRSFKRRYILPEDVKPESVQCNLSADGVLTLDAPRAAALEDKTAERPVPVVQTGQPAAISYHLRNREVKKEQCCRKNPDANCCRGVGAPCEKKE